MAFGGDVAGTELRVGDPIEVFPEGAVVVHPNSSGHVQLVPPGDLLLAEHAHRGVFDKVVEATQHGRTGDCFQVGSGELLALSPDDVHTPPVVLRPERGCRCEVLGDSRLRAGVVIERQVRNGAPLVELEPKRCRAGVELDPFGRQEAIELLAALVGLVLAHGEPLGQPPEGTVVDGDGRGHAVDELRRLPRSPLELGRPEQEAAPRGEIAERVMHERRVAEQCREPDAAGTGLEGLVEFALQESNGPLQVPATAGGDVQRRGGR